MGTEIKTPKSIIDNPEQDLTDIPIVDAKPPKREQIKKSIETHKTLKEIKTEPDKTERKKSKKASLGINKETEPDKNTAGLVNLKTGTTIIDITPEMAESLVYGTLYTIHTLASKRFKEPSDSNIKALAPPTYEVIRRWMPTIDFLKYLPEISLAFGFIAVLNDMKIPTEDKKA